MKLYFLLFLSFYTEINLNKYNKKYDELFKAADNRDKKVMLYFNYHVIRYFITKIKDKLETFIRINKFKNIKLDKYIKFYINEFDNSNNLEFNTTYCNIKFENIIRYLETICNVSNNQLFYFKKTFTGNLYYIMEHFDTLITNYNEEVDFNKYYIYTTINSILLLFCRNINYDNSTIDNPNPFSYNILITKLHNIDLYNGRFKIDFTTKLTTYNSFKAYFNYLKNPEINKDIENIVNNSNNNNLNEKVELFDDFDNIIDELSGLSELPEIPELIEESELSEQHKGHELFNELIRFNKSRLLTNKS